MRSPFHSRFFPLSTPLIPSTSGDLRMDGGTIVFTAGPGSAPLQIVGCLGTTSNTNLVLRVDPATLSPTHQNTVVLADLSDQTTNFCVPQLGNIKIESTNPSLCDSFTTPKLSLERLQFSIVFGLGPACGGEVTLAPFPDLPMALLGLSALSAIAL